MKDAVLPGKRSELATQKSLEVFGKHISVQTLAEIQVSWIQLSVRQRRQLLRLVIPSLLDDSIRSLAKEPLHIVVNILSTEEGKSVVDFLLKGKFEHLSHD